MATVFSWIAQQEEAIFPTEHQTEIDAIIEEWRPDIWARSKQPA